MSIYLYLVSVLFESGRNEWIMAIVGQWSIVLRLRVELPKEFARTVMVIES